MRPNATRLVRRVLLAGLWIVFQPFTWGQQVSVQPLIVHPVDETQLVALKGNTHPLARPEFDQGAAPPNLPMERMLLVLKRSPEQTAALGSLLDDQQDKASPNYHKWLTPEQFGKQFGPVDQDIQIVTSWLQVHGFQVAQVAKGRTVIEFSGTAAQVQDAFHTAIHKYVVDGEEHWANANDPQIPSALTPVVAGIHTLHNFLKKPAIKISGPPAAATLNEGKPPQLTFSDGSHGLTFADYATIYGARQVGVDGQGVTIAVVGRSNLFNQGEDIGDFRNAFLQCCGGLNIILNGPDPGDLGGGEEFEATLDATWSGSLAFNATVDFVVSATTNTTDGVDLSELYIIDNNLGAVMTESFSGCEADRTTAELNNIEALAEQAAAQGITYIVSSGDSGAAGCDDPNSSSASFGASVNALASTRFTVAVGGTLFNENGRTSAYWSSTNGSDGSSALSYIPEDVWNESGPTLGLWSSGGGTSAYFTKPSWQSGVVGIPPGGLRDVPDVSLSAAGHDAYVLCIEGSCVPNGQGQIFLFLVSGTSAAAPSFASIMALANQKTGSRQGQANYVLYQLAAQETLSQCNGSNTAGPPASTCVFNDVTIGNNSVPGLTGFNSGVGYDLATGLGSVNVTNLLQAWSATRFTATTTTLRLNSSTNAISVAHGASVAVNVSVKTSIGVPTGDVSLFASTGPNIQNVPLCTSPNGCTLSPSGANTASVSATTNLLPGGTSYSVTAHYPGDGKVAPSDSSPPILVTVTGEQSNTRASIFTYDANGFAVPFASGPATSVVFLRADVVGQSGFGIPSGNVDFKDNGTSVTGRPYSLNSQGNTSTPNGLPPCSLAVGPHPIVASYSGDPSFNSSNSPQVSFTITTTDFCVPALLAPIGVTAGSFGNTTLTVTASPGFSSAVSFACSGLPAESKCAFSPVSISGSGATTLTVSTNGPHAALRSAGISKGLGWWTTSLGLSLAGIFLLGVPSRRRRWSALLSMVIVAFLLLLPSCGGGNSNSSGGGDPGTPKGSYNIMVTATATGGSPSHATTFMLNVQ